MKPPRNPAPTADQNATPTGWTSKLVMFKPGHITARSAVLPKWALTTITYNETTTTGTPGGIDRDRLREALQTRIEKEISSLGGKPILSTEQRMELDPVTSIDLANLIRIIA